MSKKTVKIETSENGVYMQFVPGGTCPQINIVIDNELNRKIAIIANTKDLKKLKAALENV